LDDVRKEREGELIEVDLLQKIVQIFIFLSSEKLFHESLNVKKHFEEKILSQTKEFYQTVSRQLLDEASLSEYLHQANKYFEDEKNRQERYLTWEIGTSMMQVFKTEMLYNHQQSLLDRESGIKYLLSQDKFDDLTLLYSLYQDQPQYLSPIAVAFKEHIQL
jgi:cullin 3